MSSDALKRCLQRPISFHVVFAQITKSATAGLFLSQAWYWRDKGKHGENGWFHKTQVEWEAETGLTRYEQETARAKLRESKLISEERKGNPSRLWYRVNEENVLQAIENLDNSQIGEKPQSSMGKTTKQACGKTPIKKVEKPHSIYSETTTEITSENTAENTPKSSIRLAPDFNARADLIDDISRFLKRTLREDEQKILDKLPPKKFDAHRIKMAIRSYASSKYQRKTYGEALDLTVICASESKIDHLITMQLESMGRTEWPCSGCNFKLELTVGTCVHCGKDWATSFHQAWSMAGAA